MNEVVENAIERDGEKKTYVKNMELIQSLMNKVRMERSVSNVYG